MTDRRGFIIGAIAAPLSGAAGATGADAATSAGSSLRIAHLCDPQFGFVTGWSSMKWRASEHSAENYKADLARCERAIERINEIKPDLVLLGGDMTQRPGDVEKEWPELVERIKSPWMITPGNHDMGNRVTQGNLSRFRKVFGRDREARDVKGWRIIAGNSQFWHPTELKEEQAEYESWVKSELESAKAYGGKVILASHIPPFAFIPDEKDSYDNHPLNGRLARLESYVASGARFYLSAHQHRLVVRGYRNLVILGAEAACDNFDFRPQGFRLFEVRGDFSYSWNLIEV